MENTLKIERCEKISLVDFDRVINFFGKLRDEWKNELSTHMKISNIGVGIPQSVSVVREIIDDIGNFYELSHAEAYVPNHFAVTADFKHGTLLIRCKDAVILEHICNLWQETVEKVEISRDLLKMAIPLESLRFVFSCLDPEGRLSETPQDGLVIERCYYLQYMKEIEMSHILSRFASFLKENQNSDGGWNLFPDHRSTVLPTANALLILTSAGEFDPVSSTVRFLTSKRKEDAFWNQAGYPKTVVTAIVSLSLIKSQIYDESMIHSLLKISKILLEESQGIENDAIIIDALKQAKVNLDNLNAIFKRRIENQYFESISTPEQAISALIISHACGKSKSDLEVRKIIDRLIKLRNPDGGWPSSNQNKSSSLYTTIAAVVALNRVDYFGTE